MGRAALSFLSGLAGGYVSGTELKRKMEAEDQDRQIKLADAQFRQREQARQEKLQRDLDNAGVPASVNQNAATLDLGDGTQHVYDSPDVAASDLRQANRLNANAAPQDNSGSAPVDQSAPPTAAPSAGDQSATPGDQSAPADPSAAASSAPAQSAPAPAAPQPSMAPAIAVNGVAQPSLSAAKTSADAYNTPDALTARQAAAYAANGKPQDAVNLQNASLSLRSNLQNQADRNWQRKLSAAATTGWSGLEKLVNTTDSGPMAGRQIKIVPSEDGKNVTINTVDSDGTLTPTSLTFPNDKVGIAGAADALDNAVTPEHRYDDFVKQQQAAAQLARQNARDQDTADYHRGMVTNGEGRVRALEDRVNGLNDRAGAGTTREERLRYTTLYTDAGRNLRGAQDQLSRFQRDPIIQSKVRSDPNGPEAQQIKNLQDSVKSYSDERSMWQGLLAGSQTAPGVGAGGPAPTLKDARPATSTAAALPASKDQLVSGKWYRTARGLARWNGSAFEAQ